MKLGKKNINGFDDYVFADVLPVGYTDITSVPNIIRAGHLLFMDYKFVRKNLQGLDFALLSADDQTTIARYKGTTEANCKTLLGDTFNYWMTDFDLKSTNCRVERFSLAKTILIKNVSMPDRYAVLGYLNTTQIENNYIKFGVEGLSRGDFIEGIFDFVKATPESEYYTLATDGITKLVKVQYQMLGVTNNAGTIIDTTGTPLGKYATTGIAVRNFTMINAITKEEMVQQIVSVFENGY